MTDRELMQQALDALDSLSGEEFLCEAAHHSKKDRHQAHEFCPVVKRYEAASDALRARLSQPEQEPVATLFGSLPVYDVPSKQEPVAWIETLENAQPHCVTDLKYCSVMQHERGEHLKYIPLYKDPTPCRTCESLARTVMMDQTSHDTPPQHRKPPTQDLSAPLTVNGVPMYPQREWQGLTDEEIDELAEANLDFNWKDGVEDFARAIEAKLKEKNT